MIVDLPVLDPRGLTEAQVDRCRALLFGETSVLRLDHGLYSSLLLTHESTKTRLTG